MMTNTVSRRTLLGLIAATPFAARAAGVTPQPVQTILGDGAGREIPLYIWRGLHGGRAGTIAFSHGALSAPWKYPAMMTRWTAAGFDVMAPLHVDSTDHPHRTDYKGMAGWVARIEDMRAVSRHIGRPYIAVGHSFGALSALVLGGVSAARPEGITGPFRDPLAMRVVAFSPPQPIAPLIDAAGYATLETPALILTGTRDIPPGMSGDAGWHAHLTAYDAAAPGGHRYAAVLDGVDHYYGGAICDFTKPGPPQPEALGQALDLSLLFMTARQHRDRADFRRLDARLSENGPVRLRSK